MMSLSLSMSLYFWCKNPKFCIVFIDRTAQQLERAAQRERELEREREGKRLSTSGEKKMVRSICYIHEEISFSSSANKYFL